MARIVLDQVNLVVDDMAASSAFYRELGLEIDAGGMPEWEPHHVSARTEGTDVDLDIDSAAFASVWNAGSKGAGVVLGFRVESRDAVDELYEQLMAAGHEGQQEPYDAFWGARYAIVTDPSGNTVGLMSPVDPERRTPGPPPPS